METFLGQQCWKNKNSSRNIKQIWRRKSHNPNQTKKQTKLDRGGEPYKNVLSRCNLNQWEKMHPEAVSTYKDANK